MPTLSPASAPVHALPPQQITPGMGNAYQSASDSFTAKGAQQAALINSTTKGGSRRKNASHGLRKRTKRMKTKKYRGGDIVLPPIHGALFNGAGYQNTANAQNSGYINARAAGTNDGLVGQPGQKIVTGGGRRRRKTRRIKRSRKTRRYKK
jgi:hypothetical protein